MRVRHLVSHDLGHIFAAVVEDQIAAAWVVVEEAGHVVDLGADGDIAGLLAVPRLDVAGENIGQS